MTMLEHLDADIKLLNPKANPEAWTAACNRKVAYQRHKAGEIDLGLAKRLMTKGQTCATCRAWNGGE